VTALAERGLLGPLAGGEGSLPPAIEEVAEDENEPLAEDFGEALLDEETAGPGSDAALEDEPAAGEGVDGEEDGGDDDGGERRDP